MIIEGEIVDIYNREIFQGSVEVQDGRIVAINRHKTDAKRYIMPGFVDAHIHIESSMLTPEAFSNMVIKRGSVAVVTDPHEIANVLGIKGIKYMMESGARAQIKCNFTIPSSVPSTPFDVAGGAINAEDVERLAKRGGFVALSEVMNVPGVLFGDEEVVAKLDVAKRYGLPVDGHAPLLRGDDLRRYIESGVMTDHECSDIEEAREKVALGMKILIREGSAAKNYETLKPLIGSNPDFVMFCTDDSHPDDILRVGHIDKIVKRAIADGYPLFDVLRIATINAIEHYNLSVGTLRVGDCADFIVVSDLKDFVVEQSYIDGVKCYDSAEPRVEDLGVVEHINFFNHIPIEESQLAKSVEGEITTIGVINGEIITEARSYIAESRVENLESDLEQDVLKIVYINRYLTNGVPQVAYCSGYGLKRGAIASSIGHDSHNIVAVGCTDRELTRAINALIEARGGLVVCDGDVCDVLPLPIGGIISDMCGEEVAHRHEELHRVIDGMGEVPTAPFMLLSFLSLVVIPEIKIGEKGLFSYSKFDWIES